MRNIITDNFISKYLNNSIINEDFISQIPIELYMDINMELENYKLNKNNAKINFDQFQFELYQQVIEKYSSFFNEVNKNK